MTAVLVAFIADLRSRGISVHLEGVRLIIRPWKLVTRSDAQFIGAHREALKAIVRAEATTVVEKVVVDEQVAAAPSAPPTATDKQHEADAEQKRRDDYATAEMYHQLGRGLPRWYTG